jgi:asparagine synthase (glutamine-hydrolysing)
MRWFAGFHSPRERERSLAAVRRLAAQRDGLTFAAGPLSVAAGEGWAHPDGDICVISGRAYGTEELAAELGMAPDAPAERVLVAGFRHHGPALIEQLQGDFALFLWDAERQRGLAAPDLSARDAVYVKETSQGTAFATELRELLGILPSRPEPDALSIIRMIAGDVALPGSTLYAGVRRLPAGSCLLFDQERAQVVEYWKPRYEGTLKGSREELAGLVREEFDRAVERALGGAPRAGVLLSGGLDSSMVASAAARRGVEVRGYSAVFEGCPDLDETEYVDSLVDRWGIHRSCRSLAPSGALEAALEYLAFWEVPVLGAGYLIEHTLINEMAQHGPMAMLDGQGGDELFAISWFLPPHLVRRGRLLSSVAAIRRTPSTSTIRSIPALFEIWKRVALKPAFPLPLIEARRRRHGPPPTPPWLVQPARDQYGESRDESAWRRELSGPLWWRWLANLVLDGPVSVGRTDYVRQRRGLVGLDGGSPLLDFNLARLVLRMPPELAYDPVVDRPLARTAMRDVLPEKILARTQKSNLFDFYRDLLAGPDLRWIRRILHDPGCRIWDYVERQRVEPVLDSVPDEPDTPTALLLGAIHTMTIIECWLRQQEDPSSVEGLLEEMRAARDSEGSNVLQLTRRSAAG